MRDLLAVVLVLVAAGQVSREMSTALFSHAPGDVCAAVCRCFALCPRGGYGVLGFGAKTPLQ